MAGRQPPQAGNAGSIPARVIMITATVNSLPDAPTVWSYTLAANNSTYAGLIVSVMKPDADAIVAHLRREAIGLKSLIEGGDLIAYLNDKPAK